MAVRVLCLGNELLADDAVGVHVARELKLLSLPEVEVVTSALSGLHLLDEVSCDVEQLVIVDSIQTCAAQPGTVHHLHVGELGRTSAASPHAIGLPETLAIANALHLHVPQIYVLAVEVQDCTTVGAPLSPEVESALPAIVNEIRTVVLAARTAARAEVCTS